MLTEITEAAWEEENIPLTSSSFPTGPEDMLKPLLLPVLENTGNHIKDPVSGGHVGDADILCNGFFALVMEIYS